MITGNRFRYNSGSGGKEKISELNDVDMGIPVETNDVLMYNGLGNWTNSAVLALNRVTVSELAPTGDDQLTRQDYVNKMAKSGFSPLVYTYNSTASATTITAIGGSVWNDITSLRIGFNPENVFDGVNAQTLMQNLILPFRINVQIGGATFTLLCSTLSFDINYLICGVSFVSGPTTSYPSNGTTAYVYFTPLTDLTNVQTQITNNDTDILALQNDVNNLLLETKNTVKNSSARTYSYDTITSIVSSSYNEYGSFTFEVTSAASWKQLNAFFPKFPTYSTAENNSRIGYSFAVQVSGSGWTGLNTTYLWIGFANKMTFDDISWVTSEAVLASTFVWSTTGNRQKMIMARFDGGQPYLKTSSIAVMGYTGTAPTSFIDGDIVVFRLMNNSCHFSFYRGSTRMSFGGETFTSTITQTSLNSSDIVPCLSSYVFNATRKLKIVSQRELDALGINVNDNIFY